MLTSSHCNLYPVRGRKRELSDVLRCGVDCNLYPVRGRKRTFGNRNVAVNALQFIPRKGTETSRIVCVAASWSIAIYPCKGAKKAPPPLEHSSCGGAFCPGQFMRARGFIASLSPESLRPRPGPSASWGRSPPDGPPHPEGSAGCSPHPAAECVRFAFGTYCRWRG